MFIINTDQGYIKGELHNGLQFVEKEDARTFSNVEIELFADSMIEDLHTYYSCEKVEIEALN